MLYAVVGEGTGNKTEIIASLEDLKDKAAAGDQDFWFVVPSKESPTATDKALVKWLQDNEIYFDVVGDEVEGYEGAQNYHGAKDIERKILGLMTENRDEGVVLLALFVDTDGEAEEDETLATLVERTVEEEIEVRLLNGQMVRLTFEEGEAEDEAAAEDEDGASQTFTEAELKKMTVPELTALARGQGIAVKGMGKGDLVTALMSTPDGEEPEEPEDEAPAPAARAAKSAKKSAAAAAEAEGAVALLDAPAEARQAALVVVIVDGTVTTLPVSVGHARAILNGR